MTMYSLLSFKSLNCLAGGLGFEPRQTESESVGSAGLDAKGGVVRFIVLPSYAAKKGSGRRIPLGPEPTAALKMLLRQQYRSRTAKQ